jgi:hypothetical protein
MVSLQAGGPLQVDLGQLLLGIFGNTFLDTLLP